MARLRLRFIFLLLVATVADTPAPRAEPSTVADHAILLAYPGGEILLEKRATEHMVPASLTKLLTLYVAFAMIKSGEIGADRMIVVGRAATLTTGANLGLKIGDRLTVTEAIHAAAIASANDATVALAEALAGSETSFAARLNATARRLGVPGNFINATGLYDARQWTTARGIADLVAALLRDFPAEYALFAERQFVFRGNVYPNRNELLGRVEGVDGVKTGQLSQSGYVLAVAAQRQGKRLILVLGGLESEAARTREATRLLESGFARSTK